MSRAIFRSVFWIGLTLLGMAGPAVGQSSAAEWTQESLFLGGTVSFATNNRSGRSDTRYRVSLAADMGFRTGSHGIIGLRAGVFHEALKPTRVVLPFIGIAETRRYATRQRLDIFGRYRIGGDGNRLFPYIQMSVGVMQEKDYGVDAHSEPWESKGPLYGNAQLTAGLGYRISRRLRLNGSLGGLQVNQMLFSRYATAARSYSLGFNPGALLVGVEVLMGTSKTKITKSQPSHEKI